MGTSESACLTQAIYPLLYLGSVVACLDRRPRPRSIRAHPQSVGGGYANWATPERIDHVRAGLTTIYAQVLKLKRAPAACPEQRRRAICSPAGRLLIPHPAVVSPPPETSPAGLGCMAVQRIPTGSYNSAMRPEPLELRGYLAGRLVGRTEMGCSSLQSE